MELLDVIEIGQKKIELLEGDLTEIPEERAVDLLVLSAFPDDYMPTRTSLIGALERKGLSVEALSALKEEDLRDSFACWLSEEFDAPHTGLRFRRILCFEPLGKGGKPPELVGDIYRALVPILGLDESIRSIAMPILATGNQYWPVEEILPPLLDATIHWLESGLPLDVVRIVAYSEADAVAAKSYFETAEQARQLLSEDIDNLITPEEETAGGEEYWEQVDDDNLYDVFISFAHEDKAEMQALEAELRKLAPGVRIFLDRKSIDVGSAWQPAIFESLDHCRKVVPLFSPAYLKSEVCKEEFNIAWVRSRESKQDVLFPLYAFSAKLPTYMKYRLYLDCREGNSDKIRDASRKLLKNLGLICET